MFDSPPGTIEPRTLAPGLLMPSSFQEVIPKILKYDCASSLAPPQEYMRNVTVPPTGLVAVKPLKVLIMLEKLLLYGGKDELEALTGIPAVVKPSKL